MEINFKLSTESIDKAIKQLKDYDAWIKEKSAKLCDELIKEGERVADMCISMSPLGHTITLQLDHPDAKEMPCQAILTGIGTTTETQHYEPFNTLLAVEFGAGIRYNSTNQNPKASEFNMGVGTFPGQVHAFQKVWYYYGNDGKWHPSSGVEATMPMYNASMTIRDRVKDLAIDVFSGAI